MSDATILPDCHLYCEVHGHSPDIPTLLATLDAARAAPDRDALREAADHLRERLTRLGCDRYHEPGSCLDVDAVVPSWGPCLPCETKAFLAALYPKDGAEEEAAP